MLLNIKKYENTECALIVISNALAIVRQKIVHDGSLKVYMSIITFPNKISVTVKHFIIRIISQILIYVQGDN